MRISTRLSEAALRLEPESDSPRLDAELLLAHALGKSRTWLFVHAGDDLEGRDVDAFESLLQRRLNGEPVAYILGTREFWSVPLRVTPDTLVPRPETERLVEVALEQIPRNATMRIADLGTGSGAVAIAIALERPNVSLVACDRSTNALKVAEQNALSLNLDRIQFVESDWTSSLGKTLFDLVVSNPPYVASGDPALDRLQKEPSAALVSGDDGLDDIRRLAVDVRTILKINGRFVFEHGADQQAAVRSILETAGWKDIHQFKDYSGRPRVSVAAFRG